MQEAHKKGVANDLGSESRAEGCKAIGEALTGENAGQPWGSEITPTGVPTLWNGGEGHTANRVTREWFDGAAESETLRTRGHSLSGNRETPAAPSAHCGQGRSEKASWPTPDMRAAGESDDLTVPAKRANKAGPLAAAVSVEGRGSREGTAGAVDHVPDTEPESTGRLNGRATVRLRMGRSTQAKRRMR
jgi:hypothetical protein